MPEVPSETDDPNSESVADGESKVPEVPSEKDDPDSESVAGKNNGEQPVAGENGKSGEGIDTGNAADVKNISESNTGDSVAADNSQDGDNKTTNISTKGDSQSISQESSQEGSDTANSVETTDASAEVSQEANTSVQPGMSVANSDTDNSSQVQTHQVDEAISRRDSSASASTNIDATTKAVSDKANSFVQKIAGSGHSAANKAVNNSVMRNIVGTSSGKVTAKEQFAMGAAHTAAAVVGAQAITQHGVDQINRRKGKLDSSSASAQNHGSQRTSAHNVDDAAREMAAHAMEVRDRERDQTQRATNFIRSIRNGK